MTEKTKAAAEYLIALLNAALKDTQPPEKPDTTSFEDVYALAKFHSVQCTAYYAAEKLKTKPEAEIMQKWRMARDLNIAKTMVQLTQRDAIIAALTGAGIDVLPLKGCLLKEMYPQDDYREMADLDILIDAEKASLAREQMEKLGYITEHYGKSHHDNYKKPPYMGVELHRNMIPEDYHGHEYFEDAWTRAIKDEGSGHRFHFSWEDYYLFMLTHFAKHYFSSGSGMRSIMDIHVFLQKHGQGFDREYLNGELAKLGFTDFANTAENVAACWFDGAAATPQTDEMADYVITSGVYGTTQRHVENTIKTAEQKAGNKTLGKASYLFKRAFLPYKKMLGSYPVLKTVPVLLPVCHLHRLAKAIIFKRKNIKKELNIVAKSE